MKVSAPAKRRICERAILAKSNAVFVMRPIGALAFELSPGIPRDA